MDPDDPRTYLTGSFDLSPVPKTPRVPIPFFDKINSYLRSNKDIKFLIPIFLFLILILNLLKLFNSAESAVKENLDKEKLFQELEPKNEQEQEERPFPENISPERPSLEI